MGSISRNVPEIHLCVSVLFTKLGLNFYLKFVTIDTGLKICINHDGFL